ncbi:Transport permease protein [Vibrio chagasii]|nr:Transport permease protein [Vibrio chagasii]
MIKNYVQLVDMQARMKMRSQANKLVLSYVWWLLEPLLFVSLFYLVFEYVLNRGGDDFFVFLVVGKIIYLWFSKSVVTASKGLRQNKNIIGQRDLPKWIFPLVNIQETLYKSLISFLLLFSVIWSLGYAPNQNYWQLIPLMLALYILICGFGLFLSILVTYAQDFSNIIQLGMTGLMFSSGIFWDINSISNEEIKNTIFLINPLALIIDSFRTVLIEGASVNLYSLLPTLSLGTLFILLSIFIFRVRNNSLTRALFS